MAQAEAVTAIVFDARPATAGADQVEAAGERIIKTEQGIITATERLQKAQADTREAYRKLERQLDPLAQRQQALEKNTNLVNRRFDQGKITAERHAEMLRLLNQRYGQMQAANDAVNRSTGKFSQTVGQAGLQAQDLAVQLTSGTSAFVALGQQLPQFLGTFGPGGAIAGAVVAVGALAANFAFAGDKAKLATGDVSILDGLMQSLTRTADEQRESMDELAAAYNKASRARQDLMRVELHQRLIDEAKALKAQEKALDDIVDRVGRGIDISVAGIGSYDQQMDAFRELKALAAAGSYSPLIEQLQKIGGVSDETAKEALEAAKAILNLRDSSGQAREFLNLLEQGLVKNLGATNDASRSVDDYRNVLMELAGEQAWIDAARQGEGALRDLAKQQAINAAETKVYAAAWKQFAADGRVTAGELAEITRLVAQAGDLASDRFDLEAARKGAEDATAAQDRLRRSIQLVKFAVQDAERYLQPYEEALRRMESAAKGGRDPYAEFLETIRQLNADLAVLTRDGLNPRAWELYAAAVAKANEELNKNTVIADADQRFQKAKQQFERDSKELDDFNTRQQAARAGVDRLGSGLDRFLNDAENGIFDLADAAGALWRDLDAGKIKFEDIGKALMDSAQAGNALANVVGGMFGGRSDAQKKNAQTGGAIGATAFSMLGLPKGVGAFFGNTIGGLFGMSKADERAAKLAAEVHELSKSMNSFVRAANPLTGIAADLAGLDSDFAKLRSEAIRLKQPLEEITKSYEAQRRKIVEAFGAGIDDLINRLTGNTARADFDKLTKAQDQRIKDALLAEYDLAKVRRANALELEEFFSTLTERQLDAFGDLVTALDRVKARIRDLTATINDQLDTQIDLAQQLADSARTQAKALRDLASGLRDQIKSNLTGDLSPLSPGDRYSALSSEFDRLYQLAMAGDQVSAEKIGQAGTSFLESSRSMNATGPAYVSDFNRVQQALAQVATVADVRATALDRIADLADTQVIILGRIQDVLSTDLGKPTADAIAAAIADGVLTVDEITGINSTLDDIYSQFVGLPGSTAAAVRSTIEAIRPQLVAGTLTDAQKEALTTGQGAIANALNAFKADQLEQYRLALVVAGTAITSISNFLLDPDGRIPAAIEAAFSAVDIDIALTGAIDGLFRDALGGEIDFPPLVVRAGQTVSEAVGEWTSEALSSRINGQFGAAIATWTTSSDPRTLVQRVDAIFQQAVGGTADWQVSLTDLLSGQSPLVTNLQTLTASIGTLNTTLAARPANDNSGQTAYDAQLQSYVTGVQRAANQASMTLSTIPFDDRSGSHNNRTNLTVDASTGATSAVGGSHENDSSRQRAAQLATGLSQLAQQIQTLSGGTLGTFQIQASEEKSGYLIGSLNRLNTFGGNDFEGIARNFVADAVNSVQGGNAQALEILRATDWSSLTRGFSEAAASIYQLLNPRPMATGGLITGGLAGRDSVPILGMPGERVLSVPQSAMLETIYRQAARSGQGQPVSDPALVAEMRAIRQELSSRREQAAVQQQMIATLTARLVKSNEELAKRARTAKAGER